MSITTEPTSKFDRFFEITARGSTLSREIRGGVVTFFTMAYIVVLNPLILAGGVDAAGAQLPITALAAGTALVAGLMTILMGVVGRFPLALAAGRSRTRSSPSPAEISCGRNPQPAHPTRPSRAHG